MWKRIVLLYIRINQYMVNNDKVTSISTHMRFAINAEE